MSSYQYDGTTLTEHLDFRRLHRSQTARNLTSVIVVESRAWGLTDEVNQQVQLICVASSECCIDFWRVAYVCLAT